MSDEFSDWIESLNNDVRKLYHKIDTIQKKLASEKEAKYEELKHLLNETQTSDETPPGVMIAFLLASLRRVRNADQLGLAKFQLRALRQTLEQLDELPYRWKK